MSDAYFKLKNDTIFVVADAAGGIYNSTQLKNLCDIADEDSAFLKVTEDGKLGFMIPEEKIADIKAKLADQGIMLKHYRGPNLISPQACLGDLCPKAKQDALGVALDISPLLNLKYKNITQNLSIGINGCDTCCVESMSNDIHVVGFEDGYSLYIGGSPTEASKLACDKIPKEKIGDAIFTIIDSFILNNHAEESFNAVFKRVGVDSFANICSLSYQGEEQQKENNEPDLNENGEPDLNENNEEAIDTQEETQLDENSIKNEELPVEAISEELPVEAINEELPVETINEELPVETINEELPVENPQKAPIIEDEGYAGYERNRIVEVYDGSSAEVDEDIQKAEPEERFQKSREANHNTQKHRLSIRIVNNAISAKFPSGLVFNLPCDSLIEGECIEIELENEMFSVEYIPEKIHVKYGKFDLHIPFLKSFN